MRRACWLAISAAVSASVLPACVVVPTKHKWELGLRGGGSDPFAVGTQLEIEAAFTKGCSAEMQFIGKGTMCVDRPDSDRKIDVTATVSDPTVFSVASSGNRIRLGALREGDVTLNVKARNRRGDERSASLTLKARKPTAVRVEVKRGTGQDDVGCDGKRKPARLWFEPGQRFTLVYHLLGGGNSVVVGAPLAIGASGKPAITQVSYEEIRDHRQVPVRAEGTYVMSEPGTFALTSSTVPGFSLEGGAFACRTLTGIRITAVSQDASSARFQLDEMVGDDAVCTESAGCPITVTTLTPDVCLLPAEKPTLKVGGSVGFLAFRRGAGTCRLSAALDDTPHTTATEFAYK